MNNIVAEWYEEKKNVDEMRNWNSALKEWERSVISFFSPGAGILDIGCGLGRETAEFLSRNIRCHNHLGANIWIVVWKRIQEGLSDRM